MKNKFQLFIIISSTIVFYFFAVNSFSAEISTPSELSEGPQTLPLAGAPALKTEDIKIPDSPEAPDTPETLGSPEAPDTPKTSETLGSPEAPDSPQTSKDVIDNSNDPTNAESSNESSLESSSEKMTESSKVKNSDSSPDFKNKQTVTLEDDLLKPVSELKKKNESKITAITATESEIYIQEAEKYKLPEIYKNLHLNDVIEQGLRKNYDQNIKEQNNSLNEIVFQGAKSAFWMPQLKINLVSSSQHISTLYQGNNAPLTPTPTTPSGALSLTLSDYTLFNWGKDYALYLNKKTSYQRNKEILSESKRELKLELIGNYFFLISAKNNELIRQDQLRHASFVYRLSKEKITIGKTSKQDYYQARSEYLKAQNDYHQAKVTSDLANENLVFLLTDNSGTKYLLDETLDYRKIKITLDETFNFATKNNPTLLTNKSSIENAERSYDVAIKESLPLPKFTINLGAYNKRFGPTTNQTVYETYSSSGNIELVATLNASWSLNGTDGFLNSNKLARSRIEKELTLKEFEKNSHFTSSLIRQTFQKILSLQNQLVILDARIPSLQKSFDTILENYLSGKTKYNDFHLALLDLTEAKILAVQYRLEHLKEKLNLAKLAGLEDFPGENFEHLAVRVKGK